MSLEADPVGYREPTKRRRLRATGPASGFVSIRVLHRDTLFNSNDLNAALTEDKQMIDAAS